MPRNSFRRPSSFESDNSASSATVINVSTTATAASTLSQTSGTTWLINTSTNPSNSDVHIVDCVYTQIGKLRYYNVTIALDFDGTITFGVNDASEILLSSIAGGYVLGGTSFEMPGNAFRKTDTNEITINRDDDNDNDNLIYGSFIALMN